MAKQTTAKTKPKRKPKVPVPPPDPDALEVGTRIKARRLQLGLKQRDLQFPGCTYSYLARLESGHRFARIAVLEGLAQRLDCTVEWLRTGEDEFSITLHRETWKEVLASLDYEVRESGRHDDDKALGALLDSLEGALQVQHPDKPIASIYDEMGEDGE